MPELFLSGSSLVSSALFAVGGWLIGALMWLLAGRLAERSTAIKSRSLPSWRMAPVDRSRQSLQWEAPFRPVPGRNGSTAEHRVFPSHSQHEVGV